MQPRRKPVSWLVCAPIYVAVLAGALIAACGEEDDAASVAITFSASTDVAQALTLGQGASAIDVARLELQLREIKLLPDDKNASRVQEFGEFHVDLLDEKADQIVVEVDPGTYKKLEFKVDKPMSGDGIDGTDASLWFEGTRDGHTFRFVDDNMQKITLRDLTVDAETGSEVDVLVDLSVLSWLDGVDLGALTAGDDGLILIEAMGPNAAAHRTIERNIESAIKIARKP
ncbi:MAG: hypothetical protein KC620_02010 [Myxococcales bacterium]|nr:hypothetical protein [Myxococcales bacterium]